MNATHLTWVRRALIAAVVALPLTASADAKTVRTWKANCSSCHGAEGKADTEKGQKMKMADMTAADWQKKHSDADMKKAITEGVSRTAAGVKQEMDAFKGDKLKPEQVDALVAYIRSLAK